MINKGFKIVMIGLTLACATKALIAESIMDVESNVKTVGGQLQYLCQHIMPHTKAELKEAVKTVKTQPKAQQKAFSDSLAWCISAGFVNKDILNDQG